MSIYHRDIETLKLRANANVSHDDAAEMFGCYGWAARTEAGDFELQVVDTAWLADSKTKAEITELILANTRVRDIDTAKQIAAKAVSVWADMVAVEKALERAALAYCDGNLEACVEALREAGSTESDHGDDPSTDGLASQLLEEVEEVDVRAEFLAGFAEAAGLDMQQADEQWTGFSHNMSDAEIEREEAGGRDAGERNGQQFRAMFA